MLRQRELVLRQGDGDFDRVTAFTPVGIANRHAGEDRLDRIVNILLLDPEELELILVDGDPEPVGGHPEAVVHVNDEGDALVQIRLEGGDCSTELVLLSFGLTLSGTDWTATGLWLAVVASGLYHGVNPGMGWPLALSAGLMEKSSRALVAALWPLTAGHFLAMLFVLLPFSLLVALVEWRLQIQIFASILVIGFGVFRFVNRRHPRALARIPPAQLGLWSFAVAIAHGAGLMLLPIYLGLCRANGLDQGHERFGALINADLGMAVLVSVVHTVAMIAAGGGLAWLVYLTLGLKFVSRSWFNLDATWAVSLVLVGSLSLAFSLADRV